MAKPLAQEFCHSAESKGCSSGLKSMKWPVMDLFVGGTCSAVINTYHIWHGKKKKKPTSYEKFPTLGDQEFLSNLNYIIYHYKT